MTWAWGLPAAPWVGLICALLSRFSSAFLPLAAICGCICAATIMCGTFFFDSDSKEGFSRSLGWATLVSYVAFAMFCAHLVG